MKQAVFDLYYYYYYYYYYYLIFIIILFKTKESNIAYIEILSATTNAIILDCSKCVALKFFAEPILVTLNVDIILYYY